MGTVVIRYQRVSEARRFFEILNNPHFRYFPIKPESLEFEIAFLRQTAEKRKRNYSHNFSIIYNGNTAGAIGILVNQHAPYIGEIGYFLDEALWGRGIVPKAVALAEQIAFRKLKFHRLEIVLMRKNSASARVAEKCGYRREGLMKGRILIDGEYQDAFLYAKTAGKQPRRD